MKRSVLLCVAILLCAALSAQCLLPSSKSDTLFPVTNKPGAAVYNLAAAKGAYYLMGSFTNLVQNQGPALVVDTATNTVHSSRRWRVNGTVTAAVEDGQGGYFIAGDFTRIGDSARRYLAQVDAQGRPTSWNPRPDSTVRALQRTGDSLFISGMFSSMFDHRQWSMAIYSLSGDSLLPLCGPTGPYLQVYDIRCFVLHNDTLIYGGNSGYQEAPLRKFSLKENRLLPWTLAYPEYGPVNFLQLSSDSTTLVYGSDYNGDHIRGADVRTGAELYRIDVDLNYTETVPLGYLKGLEVVGAKAYAVGEFEHVVLRSGVFFRKGFFAFNPRTGAVLDDDLASDGYPMFMKVAGGRFFLSGNFTRVKGTVRNNFAVLDTGTLAVGPWQPAPSDALTALAFSGGRAFMAGHFNGINAVRRSGFAAIDSATGAVLPWSPVNPGFNEGKKMIVRGDSLFVLGITARPSSCMVSDFLTAFRVISLTTGEVLSASPLGFRRINDILLDGDYLYVAGDHQLRRFSLPSLTRDPSWGMDFTGYGSDHAPMCIILQGDELYTVGDNRFIQPCTALPDRTGWFIAYNKTTGLPTRFHRYKGPNPQYDAVTFEQAVLANGRLYVQGFFHVLNDSTRHNFMAIDAATGAITGWATPFSNTGVQGTFQVTSQMKLHDGRLWLGAPRYNPAAHPGRFTGFGAIDTATGNLLPPLFDLDHSFYGTRKTSSFRDFIFHGNSFVGVGDFDFVNGEPYSNFISTPMVHGTAPLRTGTDVEGPDTLYTGTGSKKYFVRGGDPAQNTYAWSYSGTGVEIHGDGRDTVWLSAAPGATSGVLTVRPLNYCGTPAGLQKTVAVVLPPLPPVPVITGVQNHCQRDGNARGRLANPPADATISLTLDGAPLAYDAADSSFPYFSTWITAAGSHTISVAYTNAAGTTRRDTTYTVTQPASFTVSITTPSSAVCAGAPVTFTATTTNGGAQVDYQWQVHGVNAGDNAPTFTTSALFNGALVKVTATPAPGCVSPTWQTSNTITMTVYASQRQSVVISGPATVNKGQAATYKATLGNGGSNPAYRWQDSTAARSWQNLAGATGTDLVYTPVTSGDRLRCIVTGNNGCATDTSNTLTVAVNDVSTSINPVPAGSYGISLFPNPVGAHLYLDNLRASDRWQTLELFSTDGRQQLLVVSVQGKTKLSVPVASLPGGYYIALLRRQSGEPVYFRLLKL